MLRIIVIILITLYSKEKRSVCIENLVCYYAIYRYPDTQLFSILPQGTAYPLNRLNITIVYDLLNFTILLPPT